VYRSVIIVTLGCWALLTVAALGQQPAAPARTGLDYEYFKTKVEPIFLKKRPGHARCISCHGQGTPMRLQPLDPGATTWTEDESRMNFDAVRRVAVVPGSLKSKLLMHPLAEDAGGDFYHNGGKHFASQNDPEWQTLRNWVMGQTRGTN
jgi:hypothetical protein